MVLLPELQQLEGRWACKDNGKDNGKDKDLADTLCCQRGFVHGQRRLSAWAKGSRSAQRCRYYQESGRGKGEQFCTKYHDTRTKPGEAVSCPPVEPLKRQQITNQVALDTSVIAFLSSVGRSLSDGQCTTEACRSALQAAKDSAAAVQSIDYTHLCETLDKKDSQGNLLQGHVITCYASGFDEAVASCMDAEMLSQLSPTMSADFVSVTLQKAKAFYPSAGKSDPATAPAQSGSAR
jgi:hypothetical protein